MALLSLIASHRNRDLSVLDQLSVGADGLGRALVDGSDAVAGAVVLPTCNRFEVYVEADDATVARRDVVATIARASGAAPADVEAALTPYEDDDAVQHLLSVASGLDSMVVGEREISGQVRRAHLEAQRLDHLTPRLDRLFQSALRTSRVVASSTGLGTSGRSVVSVALDLAGTGVDWEGARVLLVGTGALAETSVGALQGRGAHVMGVHSPSGRAREFALRHRTEAVDHDALPLALREADVVLAASGREEVALTADLLATARHGAESHPITLIDLALHRDIDPAARELPGVTVIDLDEVGARAPHESVHAIEAARAIVAHAVARFESHEAERSLDPAVVALREHVFGLLEREIARVAPAAGASPEAVAQADAIEQALRRFARTLLHTPTVRAREHAAAGDSDRYLDAIRALYGIDLDVPLDACPAEQIASHPGRTI
ncbi:glutamyl-tRNA reductase [Demequina pelophila]|uniref:glutamyl-tRNA reductase n=1 Tax=Demequina pelophila TaxID=1638984 RepID=UPI000783DD9C|nr:glutamyl-tRNA reductase [Demequina pelophila]